MMFSFSTACLFKIVFFGVLGLVLLVSLGGWVLARTAAPPSGLGVRDGKLAPCPDSPNCVSSQADASDSAHYSPPITFSGDPARVRERLRQVLESRPRVTVLRDEPDYLYAEFRSRWFGFVDDVEFWIDPEAGLIHFRSASRVGYSDLGVNRSRMERIGDLLKQD